MSATSPVFLGHGPDRFVRTGGVLSGSAIVRAAEASGTARGFVVLGEDADGIFAAEVTGSLAFEALDVSPDGSWLRARIESADARFEAESGAAAMLEAHRTALAARYADALGRACGALRPAARARAARWPDQDEDFALADVVTRTESLCLALRGAVDSVPAGAARGSALASGLLGVRDVAQRIDALALELEPWNLSPSRLVEDARALVVGAAMELPGDWLRATVARHVLSR